MRNIITRLSSFFSVVAVVMMVMTGSVKAQTITVGSSTDYSTYTYPFDNLWKNTWVESIYTRAEMASAAGCNITKIAFHDASGTGSSYTQSASTLRIYMGERATVSHSSTSDWTPAGDLQLVYSGSNLTLGNQAAGNWQEFTLTTPFSYSGDGNLVVVVAKTCSGNYNSSCTWYYQSSVTGSTYPTLRCYSDSETSYGTTHPGTNTGTQMSGRANTRFTYSGCCSVQRTGTFEFRDASNNVVTFINHVMGTPFVQPTLVNNLTPAGTPTYSSSNPDVATVNATTGAVTFTGQEGIVVITAYVPVSGSTCAKSVSYTINAGDGCLLIGDGTVTGGTAPIDGLYKNSYDQMIYSAAEIGSGGLISSIGFNSSTSNTQVRQVDIYMGETNRTGFSSATDWIASGELTLVYSSTAWNIAAGWNVFQLNEPFMYNGVGNLVIAMDCSATNWSSTTFYYTETSDYSVIYSYSDTYDAIPATIGSFQGSTGYNKYRPNLKLCIDPCSSVPADFGWSTSMAMCYLGSQPNVTLNRGGNNATATYTSSDPTVATIDANGNITTLSLGTTTISVSVPIDGNVCGARDTFQLQVICPAHIPSAQSVWVCNGQQVDLTATVRDDEGELQLQWFDAVDATTPVGYGETFSPTVSTTTTYYVAAYNTVQGCSSSRVPSTANVFEVTYDAATTNISGYVGSMMYGYAPTGSHAGATFTATGMPGWMTLNSSDGSFTGTPTAAGSGAFTITATNSAGCTKTVTINWTVQQNNLTCCDPEGFYIFQGSETFPIQQDADGYYYANVCLNQALTLRVQPRTTCSGYRYNWRLASSTGALITEQNGTQNTFTYTYDRTAGYGVTLTVSRTGSGACSVSIPIRVRVAGVFQVATRPSFDLCKGEPFNIYVSTDGIGAVDVVRPSGGAGTTLSVPDTVWLPDGIPCNGSCFFRSSVTFSDFSSTATIRNANDLLYVMLNIEHSFVGDIYIALTCPNGQRSVILPQSGSGSTDCRSEIPAGYDSWNDVSNNESYDFGISGSGYSSDCNSPGTMGTGWNYIWSNNTSRGYVYAGGTYGYMIEDENVGNDNSGSIDSSHYEDMTQIYHPYESFNNMIGCPLNGTWSIEVVDGWGIDDGYIFNWELGLNEELLPNSWTYTVDLDSAWVDCNWNSTKSGVYMEVTPPDNFEGTTSCNLHLRDEYGCVSTYDNIVTVTMHPTLHQTEQVSGLCEPYTWPRNGQTYSIPGTYIDEQVTPFGCPDYDTLVLSLSGVVYDTVDEQACNSFTWSVNGQTYTSSTQVSETLTSAMGCDSIITLNLDILPVLATEKDTTICPDNFPLTWYGVTFNAAGDNVRTLQTADGCDSTVTLHVYAYSKPNLTLPTPDGAGGCPRMSGNYVITPNITNAQTPYIYEWHGNANSYTGTAATATIPANGTCTDYVDTLYLTDANGCKDTATISFSTVDGTNPAFTTTFDDVDAEVLGYDCRYRVPDIIALLQPTDNCGIAEMIQTPLPGNDIDDNTDVHITIEDHCGNRATWDVEVKVPQSLTANELDHTNVSCTGANDGTVTLSGVAGGSPQYHYAWTSSGAGATNVTSQTGTSLSNLAPGTYTVTITDDAECSIEKSVTVDVDGAASTGVETYVVCDQFTWHGVTYTSSNNTATYTTTNAAGCDSVVTLNLTVNHSNNAIYTTTACETYEWHGVTYTESTNTPTYTTTNAAGCDSTTTLNLTVYHNDYQVHYATACDTYTWTIRGHNYTRTNSDVIVDTYTIGTCTGADTLHLTINHSSSGVDEEVACNTYTWYRNGQTYTNSTNTPSITLPNGNSFGCDSTIVLHLTINRSTSGIDAHTACDSYTWPMNSMTYTYSTNAPNVYAGLNSVGCDSTVYLHLTISHASSSVFPVTRCDTYTWPMNGQTYTYSTNTPQVTIQNHAGCDSTITLHLTINNTRYGSYVDTVCSGESLIYRGHAYPAGNHTVTITATNGCDSIVALQVVPRMPITVNIEEYHTCELGHYIVTGSINADVNHIWSCQPSDPDLFNQRHDLEIEVNPPQITDYTLNAGYGISMLCQVTATIRLAPLDLPVAGIAFQKPFLTCDDLDWTATSTSQNTQQVTWYVNDIQVSNENTISGRALCDDDSVRFSLLAVNGICTDVLDTVLYLRKSQLWFPNVFTPNLNINKTFNAIGRGIIEYELYIYTREGLLVFHTTNLEEGWRGDHNGIECPRSTYTYIARYRNEIEPDVWHKQIGTVTLLR